MQQSIRCTKRFPVRAEPSPSPTVLTNIPKLLCFVLTKTIIRDQEGRSQVNKMLCSDSSFQLDRQDTLCYHEDGNHLVSHVRKHL